MVNEHNNLREFGRCRLDTRKKILWYEEKPVTLPLKAIELLCVLVGKGGEVATKEEIWRDVWQNAFVEETNLTHNIYLLRKTLKKLGEEDVIETVPRRGYRFAGEVRGGDGRAIVIEKHTQTRTMIEIEEETPEHGNAEERIGQEQINPAKLNHQVAKVPFLRVFSAVLVVVLIGVVAFSFYRNNFAPTATAGIRSIAVLPFRTINPGKENKYQGLGLTDILITRLRSIKEISVRPTNAVMNFENEDSLIAGQKLKADAVVEGTFYRVGDKVRVTARLIRVADGSTLWNGQFERLQTDELQLQNDIALQVSGALALNLSGAEKDLLGVNYTQNGDAFALYQKGRYEWNKRSWAGMIEAQRLFRNAIDKDPQFALAYVGLADSMMMNGSLQTQETNEAITKALELAPEMAEAHATYGFIRLFHRWDWKGAEESLRRSIELNPNYAAAHHWYAQVLTVQEKHEEAKAEMRRALEIDPLSYNFLADLGQIYYFNREYKEAENYCRQALEIYPEFSFAHKYLMDIYLQTGRNEEAVEEFIEASKAMSAFDNQSGERQNELEKEAAETRKVFAAGGLEKFVEKFNAVSPDANIGYFQARAFALIGDKQNALDRLEGAFAGHGFSTPFLKADPVFDSLKNEPRYLEILQKMNLN